MRFVHFLTLSLLIAATIAADHYPNTYDNVNVDIVLQNDNLFKIYLNCLIGEGHCTPEGRVLREMIPDAILTQCAKCTDKQRSNAKKIITHMIYHRPQDWYRIRQKYDPENETVEELNQFMNS